MSRPVLSTDVASEKGRRLFRDPHCAACHVPSLSTGANANPVLANRPVFLSSDLLLHDMGALGDGIEQAAAKGREMKTPPLWGLRVRGPFLHDGRAATVDDAIRAHDGEARAARDRYVRLPDEDMRAVLAFLRTI